MVNQLPQGWKEVPFNSIFDVCNSGKEKIKQSEYLPKADGLLPVVDQGQNLVSGYSDQFQKVVLAKDNPLIVFGDHTRCVKYIDFDFVVGADGTQLIRTKENTLVKLGYYQLMSANIPNNGYSRHFKYVKEQTYKLIADKGEQKYIVDTLDAVAEMIKLRKETIQLTKDLIPAIFQEMFGDPITNPKGWEINPWGNLCNFVRGPFGGSLKKEIFINNGYLVYEQYHAINNDFTFGRYFIDEDKYKEMKRFSVHTGDILISCSGTMGKIAVVPENHKEGIINQALLKINIINSNINSVFLKSLLEEDVFNERYLINNSGAAIKNIYPISTLKNVPIITPPLSLQKEFADNVEQINQNLEVQQKGLDRLQELFDQLLQKAFTGELTRGEAYGII